MVTYRLTRIEANQPERSIELSLGELDLAYLALEDYGSCVMDESSQYYDEQVASEYSGLMFKLGDI